MAPAPTGVPRPAGKAITASRPRSLSDRARHRLRLAAALLHRPALDPERLGEDFYPAVLEVIGRLPVAARERLRGQVDWVEEMERVGAASARFGRA